MDVVDGHESPRDSQGESNAPQYVTAEQLNRAITARFAEFSKRQEKSFAELMAKLETPAAPPQQPEAKAGETPEMRALTQQLSEMRERLARNEREREEATKRANDALSRQKLKDALLARNVTPQHVERAAKWLLNDGTVIAENPDAILFRDKTAGDLPLEDGLNNWVKTEDARLFLASKAAVGSGDRGAGTANVGGNGASPFADIVQGLSAMTRGSAF